MFQARKVHITLILITLVFLLALAGCSGSGSTDSSAVEPTAAPQEEAAPAAATVAPETSAPVSGGQPVPAPDGSRPLADLPLEQRADLFTAPPEMVINLDEIYVATIQTSKGDIVVELYAQEAPQSVNNFVVLADLGFYDGLTFHRVVKDPSPFVIQGGDPLGVGEGGPGYTVPAEIGLPHLKGALAYARLPDQVNPEMASSGSQFYITLDATPFLDGGYTVFGQVIEGMDIAEKIEQGDKIEMITIGKGAERKAPTPPAGASPTLDPAGGRPLAALPAEQRVNAFTKAPAMQLEAGKDYLARVTTDRATS